MQTVGYETSKLVLKFVHPTRKRLEPDWYAHNASCAAASPSTKLRYEDRRNRCRPQQAAKEEEDGEGMQLLSRSQAQVSMMQAARSGFGQTRQT